MKNCKNKEHKKPCNLRKRCVGCGIPSCTPNYAYHVCVTAKKERWPSKEFCEQHQCRLDTCIKKHEVIKKQLDKELKIHQVKFHHMMENWICVRCGMIEDDFNYDKGCKGKEDYIDRFREVADGLKLKKEIANKIANFIHVEVMSAKSCFSCKNTISNFCEECKRRWEN